MWLCLVQWAMIVFNTLCCLATFIVILQDRFATPAYRMFRVIPFTLLFLTSIIPAYIAFNRPTEYVEERSAILGKYLSCFFCIGLGSTLYALRLPERFVPHAFDLFGHSHSLFHVLVVIGINYFHDACFMLFEYRGIL